MAEHDAPNVPGVGAGVAAPDINNIATAAEEMPSLADMAHEPSSGAWPDGWYAGQILEGYATNSGREFMTEDTLSQKGDSRNLVICLRLANKGKEARNYFYRLNYKPGDLTAETLAKVKKVRELAAREKWRGAWPDQVKPVQASALSLERLACFERALGFRLKRTAAGTIDTRPFVNQQLDVRLKLDEDSGFSEVAEVAKFKEREKLYK